MIAILVYTIHVLICFFLIAAVLLQQGKGADLSVFGGGGTQTAFGARGAATVLHKMTVGSFVAFILTTLIIGALQSEGNSKVIQDLPEPTAAETPAPEVPAAEVPGALPAGDGEATTDEGTATEGVAAEDAGGVEAGGVEAGSEAGAQPVEAAPEPPPAAGGDGAAGSGN
jgi:preprotein translocase subunit SecG